MVNPGDLLKTLHVIADHPSVVDVTSRARASQVRTFLMLPRKDLIQRVLKEAGIADDRYFHPKAEGWANNSIFMKFHAQTQSTLGLLALRVLEP